MREDTLRQLMLSASSLEPLSISSIDDLMCLPEDELHQHVSTLQTLKIEGFYRLAILPHWIGNLTSLTHLKIGSFPRLKSLPEELGSLGFLHAESLN